ncbi:BrnT family toxin [Thiolapillus sp.]
MYRFEYDEQKSVSNLEKHGIDFLTAQQLWGDSDLVEIQAKSDTEPRFLVIASCFGKYWSAVVTYRGDSIRIISVRRSRKTEVELYESARF